ncbi:serine threonine-protein kinase Chk2 [Aspergillus sclerotialis]|uniref:Serine threonine-protein kinase Chk2 n=1 Tax=Aspergillus sclerotialis TaxID=2070753 RepID=A0A3A2ZLU9_9EURO|nr:serine threonine-protein kinase Chk2 [Aspergillus sclerotialis]
MVPRNENTGSLKRGRPSADNRGQDVKKPRRSQRISSQTESQHTPISQGYLPTPLTNHGSTATDIRDESTATPPRATSQTRRRSLSNSEPVQASSSPPGDTQAFSQFVYPPRAFADEVENEAAEGVWGYLIPLNDKIKHALVLRKRDGCRNRLGRAKDGKDALRQTRDSKDKPSHDQGPPSGYLIGRHPECENRRGDMVAILEDLSSNGTFINDALVGRNKHRELEDGDEVTILHEAHFVFRYPRSRGANGFRQQYRILKQLGKGHFATVYLCVERATGARYAVKVFEKRAGESQRTQADPLHQEIALLMGVNHPNLLCLKDTFDETDGVYLVLELAPEGELFNLIVSRQKLSENETRHIFLELLEGLKYLHDRGIVHRDIKPENILVIDKKLNVKLGDFGLAKIIGEDSFTTTLCGTPNYVAPEILQESHRRKYTKAVDIWSLGVVLYICLCGFPPFSDELYTRENPYTLAQQIKMGRFDYPSPYWDSVGDPALDLIDRMLTVDVDKRITVDECLQHPWLTEKYPSITDSTDGLTGAMGQLDFSKRKVGRERTLLSSINDAHFSEHIEGNGAPVKIFHKSKTGKRVHNHPARGIKKHEMSPGAHCTPRDFLNLGQRGDPVLYEDE